MDDQQIRHAPLKHCIQHIESWVLFQYKDCLSMYGSSVIKIRWSWDHLIFTIALLWHHNENDSVSHHQLHDCLLNRLFRRRSKKTSMLHFTGLCVGNSPGTSEFPAQMASNAENVSIWWRHHGNSYTCKMTYVETAPRTHLVQRTIPPHSVESPSMVDPQWNVWHWGSRWNLHTVCWSAVGCEWGTTSVYFGIIMFALSLVDFLTLLLSPSIYFNIFYFCQKNNLNDTYKISKKFHVGLQFE